MHIERPTSTMPIPPHAKKVFQGEIFSVWQWEQEMFDGSKAIFEKLTRPDTVVVLGVTESRTILVIEEEQPGTSRAVGLPGGRVNEGEDPLSSARREFLEETGYEAADWQLLDSFQPVTKIDWAIYYFIAYGCKKVSRARFDPGEKITLQEVLFDEFVTIASDPTFTESALTTRILREKAETESTDNFKKLLFR